LRTKSLQSILDRIREDADIEHDDHIKDSEILRMMDTHYAALIDLLLEKNLYMFESQALITATAGNDTYDLPLDFLKCLLVLFVDGDRLIPLQSGTLQDVARHQGQPYSTHFRIVGNQITLYGAPSPNQVYRIHYCVAATNLATISDLSTPIDGIDGWEEYIVLSCVIQCLKKSTEDTREHRMDLAALIDRINRAGQNRAPVRSRSLSDDLLCDNQDPWRC
jgi:hypothetical protein